MNTKLNKEAVRADEWIASNSAPEGIPCAWNFIKNRTLAEAKEGRKFGLQKIVEDARWKDFTDNKGKPVRISNSLVAYFARVLIRDYPEIKPLIEIRTSEFDSLFEDDSNGSR